MKPTIFLIHGWGCDSSTWTPLLPSLKNYFSVKVIDLPGFGQTPRVENFDLDEVLKFLAEQIADHSLVLGWSLGAMLAVQLAHRYPHKVSALICLSANQKFVADENYPAAMPLAINKNFNGSFAAHPEQTLKLFSGLMAQGDSNERNLLKQMRLLFKAESINANWLQALELLARLDNRDALKKMAQPCLHLLAEKDSLVPVTCSKYFFELTPNHSYEIFAGAAHALHWSHPELVVEKILNWAKRQQFVGDDSDFKKRIAKSFSRAANTYDQVAEVQREVGETLLAKMESANGDKRVLDLGSGTGYFLKRLQEKFPKAEVMALDIAEAMLQKTRSHSTCSLICGDAEALPFANHSLDYIFSNFSLQWCQNLDELLLEINRVLNEGGQLHFTTLGENSLHEMKSVWQSVDGATHVNHFFSQADWEAEARNTFFDVAFSCEERKLYFADFKQLAKHLKLLGAHNVNSGRPLGLTGKQKLLALEQAYEKHRTPQGLPLTYEVIYGKLIKL